MIPTDMNNNDLDERIRAYRVPIRSHYRRKKRKTSSVGFLKFLVILLIVLSGFLWYAHHNIEAELADISGKHSALDFSFNFSPKRQNILLMGVDSAVKSSNPFKGNRSDTMLLISIAPYGKNVNVISIPRDSKVYLPNRNEADKINHAFAFGGAKLSVKTVEETFGVKINNYVAISNAGVIKMIDTLGGLPIYIEKDMKYDDYTAKLHINLKAGNHVLSGKETEGYLRFRHDSYGDIGRIRRQQWFANALMARLKDPSVIVKLPELLKIIPEYIETDLSSYEIAKYLGMAKAIDSSSIQIATIPGAPSSKGVISYWIIDPVKTQNLINSMVYRNKSSIDKNMSVGILYPASKQALANTLKQELVDKGITEIKMQETQGASKNYIAAHNLDVTGETMIEFKKMVPEVKDFHTIYDPVGINRTGKDLTIVISAN